MYGFSAWGAGDILSVRGLIWQVPSLNTHTHTPPHPPTQGHGILSVSTTQKQQQQQHSTTRLLALVPIMQSDLSPPNPPRTLAACLPASCSLGWGRKLLKAHYNTSFTMWTHGATWVNAVPYGTQSDPSMCILLPCAFSSSLFCPDLKISLSLRFFHSVLFPSQGCLFEGHLDFGHCSKPWSLWRWSLLQHIGRRTTETAQTVMEKL